MSLYFRGFRAYLVPDFSEVYFPPSEVLCIPPSVVFLYRRLRFFIHLASPPPSRL